MALMVIAPMVEVRQVQQVQQLLALARPATLTSVHSQVHLQHLIHQEMWDPA